MTSRSVDDINRAEDTIIKCVRKEHFNKEFEELKQRKCLSKSNSVYKLEPFFDKDGIIRVGG